MGIVQKTVNIDIPFFDMDTSTHLIQSVII